MPKISRKKINLKYVWQDFINNIWSAYFYLLGFYAFSRFLSLYAESWRHCNWRAFDIFIICVSILSLFHPSVISFIKRLAIFLRQGAKEWKTGLSKIKLSDVNLIKKDFGRGVFYGIKSSAHFLAQRIFSAIRLAAKIIKSFLAKILHLAQLAGHKTGVFFISRVKKIHWSKILAFKLFLIIILMGFALSKNIAMIDFWILLYALLSILFIIESRIAASLALICLICCPFLLVFKQDILAEAMAVYAYYFLIITVLTQIREIKKEGEKKSVDNLVASKKNRVIIRTGTRIRKRIYPLSLKL